MGIFGGGDRCRDHCEDLCEDRCEIVAGFVGGPVGGIVGDNRCVGVLVGGVDGWVVSACPCVCLSAETETGRGYASCGCWLLFPFSLKNIAISSNIVERVEHLVRIVPITLGTFCF